MRTGESKNEYQQPICHECTYPHPPPMVPKREPPVDMGTYDPMTGKTTGGDARPTRLRCWFAELLTSLRRVSAAVRDISADPHDDLP